MAATLVTFTGLGTIRCSDLDGQPLAAANYYVVNSENSTLQASGVLSSSGSATFSFPNAHVSKDQYVVAISKFGYLGDARVLKDLSPTEECVYERFLSPNDTTSGTVLVNDDFESATLSGYTTLASGGSISISGLSNSTNLQGNYHVRLASAGTSALTLRSNNIATSGITCGRATFLARGSTGTSTSPDNGVGFSFMRQGSNHNSNGLQVLIHGTNPDGNNNRFLIRTAAGALSSANDVTTGTVFNQEFLYFSNQTVRDDNRKVWITVEWEKQAISILMRVYLKLYRTGDTADNIQASKIMAHEMQYTGTTGGADFYTTSDYATWYLGSDSNSTGDVGFDCIKLESLAALDQTHGINKFEVLAVNSVGNPTPKIISYLESQGPLIPPEGIIKGSTSNTVPNYFLSRDDSIYGRSYIGPSGMRVSRAFGGSGDNGTAVFRTRSASSAGIRYGSARLGINLSNDTGSKIGFLFLRQGSLVSDNCYGLEIFRNAADDFRFRLRKGSVFTTPIGVATTFAGTTLFSSSTISGFEQERVGWFELRWQADATQTKIEVLYMKASTKEGRVDSSPGNVDYGLVSQTTYTDTSSPYLTTTEKPLLIMQGQDNGYATLCYFDLRRAKVGN